MSEETPGEGKLVWMDLEMTGLDVETDTIIEIATLVTDDQLNEVAAGPTLAIQTPEQQARRHGRLEPQASRRIRPLGPACANPKSP